MKTKVELSLWSNTFGMVTRESLPPTIEISAARLFSQVLAILFFAYSLNFVEFESTCYAQAPIALQQLQDRLEVVSKAKNWEQTEVLATEYISLAEKIHGNDAKLLLLTRRLVIIYLTDAANGFRDDGKYVQAEKCGQKALAECEKAVRPADLVLKVADSLARTHLKLSNDKEAFRMYEWRIAILEQQNKSESVVKVAKAREAIIASTLSNMALYCIRDGRLDDAEKYYRRTLAVREKSAGGLSKDIAETLDYIGEIYADRRDFQGAITHHERSLRIREQLFGHNSPETTPSLLKLAECNQSLGKSPEAESLCRRAILNIDRIGADMGELAETFGVLGNICLSSGRLSEARRAFEQQLVVAEKVKDTDGSNVVLVLARLVQVCKQNGDWPDVVKLLRRQLEINERLNETNDNELEVISNQIQLSFALSHVGDVVDADVLIKHATDRVNKLSFQANKRKLEKKPVIAIIIGIAANLCDEQRYKEAESISRRGIFLVESMDGDWNQRILGRLVLSESLFGQAAYAQAEAEANHGLDDYERHPTSDKAIALLLRCLLGRVALTQCRYSLAIERLHPIVTKLGNKTEPDDTDENTSKILAVAYLNQGRIKEAETLANAVIAKVSAREGKDPTAASSAYVTLASVKQAQGALEAAAGHLRTALKYAEDGLRPDDSNISWVATNLAEVYVTLGRLAEAEALFQRAFRIQQKKFGAGSFQTIESLDGLAHLAETQGQFANAEVLRRQTLAIRERTLGGKHPDTASAASHLAAVLAEQHRFREAEQLLEGALQTSQAVLGSRHTQIADMEVLRASILLGQRKLPEAEAALLQAITVFEEVYGKDQYKCSEALMTLAKLCLKQERFGDAESLCRRVEVILEKALPPNHSRFGDIAMMRAQICFQQRKFTDAEPYIDRAVTSAERWSNSPAERALRYDLRAQIGWELGRRSEAVTDLEEAMRHAELQRGQYGGNEVERAGAFGNLADIYERMIRWKIELGDPSGALQAIESSRARSLLDEMTVAGADLNIGQSLAEREQLRSREAELRQKIAATEQKLDSLANGAANERAGVEGELAAGRDELYRQHRDARSANPTYRNLLSVGAGPPRLGLLQRELIGADSLMLVYSFGTRGGYVVIVSRGGAKIVSLEINEEMGKILGCEAGALTAERLRKILIKDDGTGIVQLLASSNKKSDAGKLEALWKVLVPEAERSLIVGGKLKRLMLVPDGTLALLPFETLVVEAGAEPRYLLDAGPPIVYAPSATVLLNLSTRKPVPLIEGDDVVISLGDPKYPANSAGGQVAAASENSFATASRYTRSKGSLTQLPHSGLESRWVIETFAKAKLNGKSYQGVDATESQLRNRVAGRKVVHLACHGLVDQNYGNFFGALALTPGAQGSADAADDGFITLPEIYALDLKSCQLAILSACQTNIGPEQVGEGTWALSRGFLVAGAKRVVATNWLVDDEATSNLVSVFCDNVASGAKAGNVDYAASLQKAKRWVSQQEKWKSPYYWGSFVLVGPN